MVFSHSALTSLVLPQFGPGLRFKREPQRKEPRFGHKSKVHVGPNVLSSSVFNWQSIDVNLAKPKEIGNSNSFAPLVMN